MDKKEVENECSEEMPVPKLCNFCNEDVVVTGHYKASLELITYRIDIFFAPIASNIYSILQLYIISNG